MVVKALLQTPFEEITECFNEAFSDYFLPFHAEAHYLKRRWQASGVDYSLSFGAFARNRLVGILITASGEWLDEKTAYIAATGVVPNFRNQGIARRLFETALPVYRSNGMRQSILEVMEENLRAIDIYQKTGYRINRKLLSFQGSPVLDREISWTHFEIKQANQANWEKYKSFIEYRPTWDYCRIGSFDEAYKIRELYDRGVLKGYLIVQPANGLVMQFGVEKELGWFERSLALFDALQGELGIGEIKVNNIDESASNTLRLVRKLRLHNFLNQFEMKLTL